jgi:hypothetical protein
MSALTLLRRAIATILFLGIAYFPWYYWETARQVMRGERPEGALGLDAQGAASLWWLMGMGLIVWLPVTLAVAFLAARFFLSRTAKRRAA